MISTKRRVASILTMAFGLAVLAACGDGETSESSAGNEPSTETTQPTDPVDNSGDDQMTTEVPPDGVIDDGALSRADLVIEASVANGEVVVENNRIDVALGSTVVLHIESDVADEAHLHGYDITAAVGPDSPGELMFTADVTGVFEVELESAGTFLFEVAVGR